MVKIKYFSVYSDFKTSFFAKIFFFFSAFFLFLFILITVFDIIFPDTSGGVIGYIASLSDTSLGGILIALVILCTGLGIIALFFHHQFKKLADIAEDIESMQESEGK